MRMVVLIFVVFGSLLLSACGVPRAAGTLAAEYAAGATTLPADDAAVRQEIVAQDAAWANLSQLLGQREFGGISGVDAQFVQLVDQAAALAKRDHDLVAQNQDDPVLNRQALQRFHDLWQLADKYLNQ